MIGSWTASRTWLTNGCQYHALNTTWRQNSGRKHKAAISYIPWSQVPNTIILESGTKYNYPETILNGATICPATKPVIIFYDKRNRLCCMSFGFFMCLKRRAHFEFYTVGHNVFVYFVCIYSVFILENHALFCLFYLKSRFWCYVFSTIMQNRINQKRRKFRIYYVFPSTRGRNCL